MEKRAEGSSSEPRPAILNPGTYVVQIPKDQIYRVPPDENAAIASNRRPVNNQKRRKSSSSCSNSCYCCVFLAIFIVIVAVVIYLLTYFLQPRNPIFQVTNLVVIIKPPTKSNSSSSSKRGNQTIEYRFRLGVRNPDWRSGVSFQKGGAVSLLFKQHEIGEGAFPTLQLQKNGASAQIAVQFKGSNHSALPNQVEVSLQGKSKLHLPLILRMNLLARMRTSLFNSGDARLAVVCELVADTLAKGTRIMSQNCRVRR